MTAARPDESARGIVTADVMVFLNTVALYLVTGLLIAAFVFEFARDELPCPLCLLQRIALSGMAAGLILNLRFGLAPAALRPDPARRRLWRGLRGSTDSPPHRAR